MNFGKRLKEVRVSRDLSQKEAALKVGISSARLSNYETNRRQPSIGKIVKFAQLYNVSADYLFCLIDSPDPLVSEVSECNQTFGKVDGQSTEDQIEDVMNVKEVLDSLEELETPYLMRISLLLESAIEELEQKKKIEEIHSLLINE